MENVNKKMYHAEHVPHSFLDVSRCSHANQRQGYVQESVLQLDLLLFFTVLAKSIQQLFTVKYLSGEANFASNFLSLG